MENIFFKNYFSSLAKLINRQKNFIQKLKKTCQILRDIKKKNKKVFIFGNGGSSAIASHVTIDLSNICKIKTFNFNDASLITCFSNDFGYENWMTKTLDLYGEQSDILLVISSSGESKNIINACLSAKKKKFDQVITFTGFKKSNSVSKLGDINFWVNSKSYNFIENVHQILLLSIVDCLKLKLNNIS
jgi:D-sedoheptulose 7-phosphate isomerase